mmetsp:Transcript_33364/g.62777  ORF Transcript_33364/g.62777 Transcript_33364/m.62777 type:complete len:290 (-) Transcript_33364:27-896(-)
MLNTRFEVNKTTAIIRVPVLGEVVNHSNFSFVADNATGSDVLHILECYVVVWRDETPPRVPSCLESTLRLWKQRLDRLLKATDGSSRTSARRALACNATLCSHDGRGAITNGILVRNRSCPILLLANIVLSFGHGPRLTWCRLEGIQDALSNVRGKKTLHLDHRTRLALSGQFQIAVKFPRRIFIGTGIFQPTSKRLVCRVGWHRSRFVRGQDLLTACALEHASPDIPRIHIDVPCNLNLNNRTQPSFQRADTDASNAIAINAVNECNPTRMPPNTPLLLMMSILFPRS